MQNKIYYIFITAFLLLITAPFWGMLFYKNKDTNEKRVLTKITDVKGITGLNQFIIDNHAFRDKLSELCISFYVNFLKESPLPAQTVFGKKNWMFLGNDYMNVYNASLGINPIWSWDVDKTTKNIAQIKQFCDSLDIDFYFVIAPNKASIYPEYLNLKPNSNEHFSLHVTDTLKSKYNIQTIDLFNILKNEKEKNQIYYKFDSHWNNLGALLATQKIIAKISENHTTDSVTDNKFNIEKKTRNAEQDREYDLSTILNLKVSDTYYDITPKKKSYIQDTIVKRWGKIPIITHSINNGSNNKTKAFVIRDSFFIGMNPYFMSAIHDATLFMLFNKEHMVEEIQRFGKPDFLIYIIAERNLSKITYQ